MKHKGTSREGEMTGEAVGECDVREMVRSRRRAAYIGAVGEAFANYDVRGEARGQKNRF